MTTRTKAVEPESEPLILPLKPETVAGNGAMPDEPAATSDIFDDLERLRLRQTFDRAKIRKPFISCPIRKPRRHEWFQSHRDPAYQFETRLFALKEGLGIEWYLPLDAEVLMALDQGALYAVTIFVWINRKSDLSLWPVPLFDMDGRETTGGRVCGK
jgi:hypothetical protein